MLFSKTNNSTFIYIYSICVDIFIGFSVFALFFGVFANYFYDTYIENKVKADLTKSLSFYKLNNKNDISTMLQFLNLGLTKEADDDEKEFSISYNRNQQRNKFIYLILYIIAGLFILVSLPLITGLIRFDYKSIKFILINYLMHIAFVIGFEFILLLCIIPFIHFVNIGQASIQADNQKGHGHIKQYYDIKNYITSNPQLASTPQAQEFLQLQ